MLIGLIVCSGLVARETKAYLDADPTLRFEPQVSTLEGTETLARVGDRR